MIKNILDYYIGMMSPRKTSSVILFDFFCFDDSAVRKWSSRINDFKLDSQLRSKFRGLLSHFSV